MIMSERSRRVTRAVFGSLDGPSRSDLAAMLAGNSDKDEVTFDDFWIGLDRLLQNDSNRYETKGKEIEK